MVGDEGIADGSAANQGTVIAQKRHVLVAEALDQRRTHFHLELIAAEIVIGQLAVEARAVLA